MKVQLLEPEFDRLIRLVQAVDLIEARHRIDLATATTKRNNYYTIIAAAYGLPTVNVALAFDDDTHTIDVPDPPLTLMPKGLKV